MRKGILAAVVAVVAVVLPSCGGGNAGPWFYPYEGDAQYFDWEREWPDWTDEPPYGGYTIIRRPVSAVDYWTSRALSTPPYRGYRVRRHNSPVVEYTATRADRTIIIRLTPMSDSTRVEVRARQGRNRWVAQQAKTVASTILRESLR